MGQMININPDAFDRWGRPLVESLYPNARIRNIEGTYMDYREGVDFLVYQKRKPIRGSFRFQDHPSGPWPTITLRRGSNSDELERWLTRGVDKHLQVYATRRVVTGAWWISDCPNAARAIRDAGGLSPSNELLYEHRPFHDNGDGTEAWMVDCRRLQAVISGVLDLMQGSLF